MNQKLIIIKNKVLFYKEIANQIEKEINQSFLNNMKFTLVLSGGKTPKLLFNELSMLSFKKKINWGITHLFQADERCVAIDDDDRNYKLIYKNLIDKINIPDKNLHFIQSDLSNPEKAAFNYENEIKSFFNNEPPSFDLIILGIGEDGHTASLFPDNKKSFEINNKLVINTFSNITKPFVARLSMTLKLINNAKNVFFIISGENKIKIVKEIINKNLIYTASLVLPKNNLFFYFDNDITI